MPEEKKPKNIPIYKKWWFWVLIVVVLFICAGVAGSNKDDNDKQVAQEEFSYSEGSEQEIEKTIRDRAKEKYEDSSITDLLIFDETDNGVDDYTVMIYLNFDRKNKSDTAKDLLKVYSSDLAATVGNENSNVNQINIYWRIPYLMENGDKVGNGENYWIYERKDNGMALKDENWIYK